MGNRGSSPENEQGAEVSLDDFHILRAIGKGSFSKVCIVQKKDTKHLYAMKYMDKIGSLHKDAFRNIVKEVEILASLSHPFLINLWYTFQDQEDMFLVFDLLLGGDLRFHLNQKGLFDPEQVKLYLCELALALDYIHKSNIVHRDIKPDNILLDEQGHAHITDFNIATSLREGSLATSSTGTKPYMAPEIFATSLRQTHGYTAAVDWWSLGVCIYEMLKGRRPYDIRSETSTAHAKEIIERTPLTIPCNTSEPFFNLIKGLLEQDPSKRLTSINKIKTHPFLADVKFEEVLRRKVKPKFVPPKGALNCDPTYELEEMIIEDNPLHKKKKRSHRQSPNPSTCSELAAGQDPSVLLAALESMSKQFKVYNREKILKDEERRIRRLEEELGIRPATKDAIAKRLGRKDTTIG